MSAKKVSNSLSYREVLTSVRKGEFAPVYILMGEEAYYIDLVAKAIEQGAVPEEEKDFNANIFYGQDADIDMVITAAKQFPMMAERRLVMLKEAQTIAGNKTTLDRLAPYVERPNPTCVFVIVYKGDTLNTTSKLIKAAKSSGAIVVNSPAIRDYEISSHITDYCTSRRVTIDDKAKAMLTDFVGSSLSKLAGELDKLILANGSGGNLRITPEMVERNIGVSKEYNSFELTDAIANLNYTKAMKIITAFERNPRQNPTAIVSATLFNYFQKMVIASMQKDQSDASLMQALELKSSYALRGIRTGLRHFTVMRSINAIAAIREFDAHSKGIGSMQNEHALLKQLVFKLFTGR